MEKKADTLKHHIRQSGETLLRIQSIPAKLKRDLRDLLNFSDTRQLATTEQIIRLLDLYERSVKIMTSNPGIHQQHSLPLIERELISQLADELQTLIAKLDFSGEAGDMLMDIGARIIVEIPPKQLLELTLEVLRLVIQGTKYERNQSEIFLKQINDALMSSLSCTQRTIKQGHHHLSDWKTITQEFSQLIEKNNAILSKEQSLESLKTDLSVLVSNYQALSIRLKKSERREQALIEELEVAQARLHSTYDATQDFQHRFDDQAQRVLKDPLTKVYNRTAFNNRLELEYHRWIRTQHPLRLVLFDIDHFKGINQKFGYSAGDKALRIIARTLLKTVSDTDTVARFAGEEFLVIMPERDEQSCYLLVQKIQRHIKELPFKFKEIELTITVSAVSVSFQENNTPEEVLERLYHQLLKSKSTEPNQITWQ